MRRDATALSCTRTSRYVSFAFDCVARYVSAIYIRYLCTCVCLRVCKFMEATQFAKCIYAMLHISIHIYIYICVLNLYVCVLLPHILKHRPEYSYTVAQHSPTFNGLVWVANTVTNLYLYHIYRYICTIYTYIYVYVYVLLLHSCCTCNTYAAAPANELCSLS